MTVPIAESMPEGVAAGNKPHKPGSCPERNGWYGDYGVSRAEADAFLARVTALEDAVPGLSRSAAGVRGLDPLSLHHCVH